MFLARSCSPLKAPQAALTSHRLGSAWTNGCPGSSKDGIIEFCSLHRLLQEWANMLRSNCFRNGAVMHRDF